MKIKNIPGLAAVIVRDGLDRGGAAGDNSDHVHEAIQWLCRAQDATADGGVSEGFHFYHGWLPSYPETSGYIIETFFDYAAHTADNTYSARAIRMADWLISVQNPDGAIPDSYFREQMVFDTGQVLFGFVRAWQETGNEKYLQAAHRSGKWLIACMNSDGTWTKCALNQIPHTYYSRVAWSLLVLHSVSNEQGYVDAAAGHINWVQKQQEKDGWFRNAGFSTSGNMAPFTHTIAYTIRGVLECGLYLNNPDFLQTAMRAADAIAKTLPGNGRMPGTYGPQWTGDARFSCLTGNAQMAIVYGKLYKHSGNDRYLRSCRALNHYLKTRQDITTRNMGLRGAVAGSFPVWGKYIHFCYPNWAAKFLVDSLMLEQDLDPPD